MPKPVEEANQQVLQIEQRYQQTVDRVQQRATEAADTAAPGSRPVPSWPLWPWSWVPSLDGLVDAQVSYIRFMPTA